MQPIPLTPVLGDQLLPQPLIPVPVQLKCCRRCVQKICNFVKEVFYCIFQTFLFIFNPTIYAISFVAGIVAYKHMDAAVERIKKIWKATSLGILLIGAIGAFLSLPITLATASWAFATQLSCRLVRKVEKTPVPAFQTV